MASAYRRRTGGTTDHVGTGRRRLAAIDPGLMARVVGRPTAASEADRRIVEVVVPPHRRPY